MPTEAQINANRLTQRFSNRHSPRQLNHLCPKLGSFRQVLLRPRNGFM